VIRVWLIPFSTNVERVSLALAHKGLEAEPVEVSPDDRSEVGRVSGQDLVPVADLDGEIVADSTAILRRMEELHPEPPLWPTNASARAETDIFIEWFNRVWKGPPNEIAAEIERGTPDQFVLDRCAGELEARLRLFESLLDGRDYLLGDSLSAADCVAFPFLKYAAMRDPADDELFHRVLEQYQRLGDDQPNLTAWIERVNGHPRAF
jgi:glutathione S-transferase